MTPPRTGSFSSQRLHLNFLDWGNEAAPTIILVHGGRDHAHAWDDVAARLAAHYHVVAPDLRGHGDSAWANTGGYTMPDFILDLAELVRYLAVGPVTLIGHSLGGNIATRFAGLYPDAIRRLVNIEGLGPSPRMAQEQAAIPIETRMHGWIDEQRQLAARGPRLYDSPEAAQTRMQAHNPHLSAVQAEHLTRNGLRQTADGRYAWKFDPFLRSWPPIDFTREEISTLWARITCPVRLIYGTASWASNPALDGRANLFRNATIAMIGGAGHWAHHDRLDDFMRALLPFLDGGGKRLDESCR